MKGICVALLLAVGWPMTAAAQDRMPPIPPEKMTDAQRQAADEFRAARMAERLGAVRAAAAQPRGHEPRAGDGRLPALQERLPAAPQRVRDPDHRAPLDAELRVGRAPSARAQGRPARGRSPAPSPKGGGRSRWPKTRRSSTTSAPSCIRTRASAMRPTQRTREGVRRAGRHRRDRHLRLLHVARHGPEYRAHAAAGRPRPGARAVPALSSSPRSRALNESGPSPDRMRLLDSSVASHEIAASAPGAAAALRRQRLRRAHLRSGLVPAARARDRLVGGVDRRPARHVHGRHVPRQPAPAAAHCGPTRIRSASTPGSSSASASSA